MNAPDKCPRCGSEFHPVTARNLNTLQLHAGNWNQDNEREFCLIRQRDQLRAQVEQRKAYAERSQEAGDEVAATADQDWEIPPNIESAIDDWTAAKETKP